MSLFTDEDTDDNREVNYLEEMKKKFAKADGELDVEALAKGKYYADKHNSDIERELAELREDFKTNLTLEKVMAEIKAVRTQAPSNDDTNHREEQNGGGDSAKYVTPEQVKQLLEQEKTKLNQERNVQNVVDTLKSKYGADYTEKLDEVARKFDYSRDELGALAADKPTRLLKMVDDLAPAKPQEQLFGAPVSSRRTVAPGNTGTKNYAFYQKMRKDDPSKYHTLAVVREMHDMAEKLGEDFYR